MRCVGEYELGRLGAFPYSHEEGTEAYGRDDLVPEEEVQERLQAVLAARDEVLFASQRARIGREVEVLVDESHPGGVVGHTDADAPEVDPYVMVPGSRAEVGDRIRVEVREVEEDFALRADAPSQDS